MNVYGIIIVIIVVAGAWMLFTPAQPGRFDLAAPREMTLEQYQQGAAEDCLPGET